MSLLAVLVGTGTGLVGGALVPRIIAAVPEPEPAQVREPDQEPSTAAGAPDDDRQALPPPPPKVPYSEIAAAPGLVWWAALVGAGFGALLGWILGWDPMLLVWLPLVPIAIALAVIDWRTTLLPTRIIAPTYVMVVVAVAVVAALTQDWRVLLAALLGWLVMGGLFFVLWFIYPRGLGYGDVRLAGVLGLALGPLGWPQLLLGAYAGFLVGGIAGVLLSVLKMVNRKRYPFGPFILIGVPIGIVWGPALARSLGY